MVGESPPFCCSERGAIAMAVDLEKIRTTADRVAGSYGLEVVDAEFVGGGKHRVLRVSIEKDGAGGGRGAREGSAGGGGQGGRGTRHGRRGRGPGGRTTR